MTLYDTTLNFGTLKTLIIGLAEEEWIENLVYNRHGHANVYLVGGCVRDAILNKPIKDIDLIVEGLSMKDIMDVLQEYGKFKLVGESFAVIKFRPKGHVGEDYDIAVPRKDRKIGDGHKDFEIITKGVDIFEDLKRRDFTCNSIAIRIEDGEVFDPFGGYVDIMNKVLRATDEMAFVDDALRIVRAIQFASRLGFIIESNTLDLMLKNVHLIKHISAERILDEFNKIILKKGSTRLAFELIGKCDLDLVLFGKKFDNSDMPFHGYYENLDIVSFYYLLAKEGNSNLSAWRFYSENLKGGKLEGEGIVKALQSLERFIKEDDGNSLTLRWRVFSMLKSSLMLKDVKIFEDDTKKVLALMNEGSIPMKLGDIPVDGNDLMEEFKVSGKEVGMLINVMYQDALRNAFNWRNKEATITYLRKNYYC